jgi:thiaminase (transcriptional activator TenA)
MGFCDTLWQEIAPLRTAILAQPFLQELQNGTLSRATFQRYLVQDSLYLGEYARVLALAAARAPDAGARLEFSEGARVAVQVEEALHQHFFALFGLDKTAAAHAAPSPTCLGYTGFLAQTAATRSYGETVAALLPCFWIYWEVGCAVKPASAPGNPYSAWIETYADPGFGATTQRVISIVNNAATTACAAEIKAMASAFKTAARYEWMFWDSAYRNDDWPIAV